MTISEETGNAHRPNRPQAGHDARLYRRGNPRSGYVAEGRQLPGGRRAHRGEGRVYGGSARRRQRQDEERFEAATGPFRQGQGGAEGAPCRVPRLAGCRPGGRRGDHSCAFYPGPICRCRRHQHRQGLCRGDETAQFWRAARQPRRVALASQPRLDRPASVAGQDFQEQEDGRSPRCRAGNDTEPRGRRRRCRARRLDDQGVGAGEPRRLRADQGCSQAQAALAPALPGSFADDAYRRRGAAGSSFPMKLTVWNLDNQEVGDIELAYEVFGLPVRRDILARVVNWQLAKRRAGTHKTKGISEIQGTTRKPYKQKGTGRARQGSLRSPQFRGGATIFGPVVRSHEFSLQKKVRKLGLKTALSSKQQEGKLVVIDAAHVEEAKTKALRARFETLGWDSVLIIDGPVVEESFVRAARNLPRVDVLPQQGANVYDILRRDTLVLTRDAVQHLEARLK